MKKLLLFLFCALSTSIGFAQTTFTLNIVNDNTSISDPWVTFVSSLNVVNTWETNGYSATTLNGTALSATAGATSLVDGTSYQLSTIGNSITVGSDWAGNIFFSDSDISSNLGSSGQSPVQTVNPAWETHPESNPKFLITATSQPTLYATNPGSADATTQRYNYIELGGGSSSTINPDVTYINYASVPLQMANSTGTRGTPSSQGSLDTLTTRLAALTGNNPTAVVTSGGQIVRVIGPDSGSTISSLYQSFGAYITSSVAPGAKTIQLSNAYSGHGSLTGLIANQTYTPRTATPVTYDGTTLTIKGTSTEASVGDFTMTATITPAEFSDSIYAAVISYSVTYAQNTGSPITIAGNTGDNNVFSAVSRDLLAGYSYGFINSTNAGDMTSAEWQTLSNSDAFANAQPDNTYYNTWAAEIAGTFGDVYSFPFNDFLNDFSPELTTASGDTLTVTMLGVNPVPEPSTIAMLGLTGAACCMFVFRKRKRS